MNQDQLFDNLLNSLAQDVYNANKEKGFHDSNRSFAETAMLIVSEISEAVEADRKGKRTDPRDLNFTYADFIAEQFKAEYFKDHIKDTVEDELADAFIRILDEAGRRGMDIGAHVRLKLAYNKTRPRLHGKTY